jgi:hypothetical protein
MKHGFEWDENPFGVNQMGHPYQGSNYFTAGRANGLSFWEASSVAAFGSATWEFYFENNRASLNDLVNTTLGGIAFGEMLHRTAWLVRDTTATGRSRKTREIVAAAIDPMTGMTRFISGDASRVVEAPAAMIPSSTAMLGAAGILYQGANLREVSSAARPFLDLDLLYGDVLTGRSRTPYEAFALRFVLGGGNVVSESNLRGRLLGQPIGNGERYQFTLFQTFDYTVNRAYVFGAQGFEADVAMTRRVSARRSVRLSASGGVNALAAVDSLVPAPPGSGASPAEIADAPRKYDYGPGARFGGSARFLVDDLAVANLSYQGYQVSVVDGFRATHVVQRLRLELQCPLPDELVIGASAEYFFRKAYYWAAHERTDQSPQFRMFLAWRR